MSVADIVDAPYPFSYGDQYPNPDTLVDGVDPDKRIFPPGTGAWGDATPTFWQDAVGYDFPRQPAAQAVRNIEKFQANREHYLREYLYYVGAGCKFGQWWAQKLYYGQWAYYAGFDLVDFVERYPWLGNEPIPGGSVPHAGAPSPLFGFNVRQLLYYTSRGPSPGNTVTWLWNWPQECLHQTYDGWLIYQDEVKLVYGVGAWIMAFMHQLQIIRTVRECFGLPFGAKALRPDV